MEDYSRKTSRRKPICITDVVIHGYVCDLSTKADEDPKINMCIQARVNQMLAALLSAHVAPRSNPTSLDLLVGLGIPGENAGADLEEG